SCGVGIAVHTRSATASSNAGGLVVLFAIRGVGVPGSVGSAVGWLVVRTIFAWNGRSWFITWLRRRFFARFSRRVFSRFLSRVCSFGDSYDAFEGRFVGLRDSTTVLQS